jgi:hypothetical protein
LKRVLKVGAVVLGLVAAGVLGRVAWQAWVGGEVAAGYSAKVLCSCVFVSQRDPESCRAQELSIFDFVRTKIDREAGVVDATALWIGHARAEYEEGFGCTVR